ncbi:MAG: glutathione S-transferase family protein, partial [Myxococcales bacterium]|nr:glutathione S-transferase family protein [Myxococcales bacterium]
YYAPRTRSVRARWILEELGVDYELVTVNLTEGEHKQADYLKIHPLGRVPALLDGELALFESGAICLYLADKYLKKGLAPKTDAPERGTYYAMMALAMSELDPTIALIFDHRRNKVDSSPVLDRAQAKWSDALLYLEGVLVDRRPWILGDDFSAADIMIGSVLIWAQSMGLLGDHPHVEAYAGRLISRPAYHVASGVTAAS